MAYTSVENVMKKPGASIYKLVLAAAARANELALGAQPLIKAQSRKVATLALEEIVTGKVRYEDSKTKPKKAS